MAQRVSAAEAAFEGYLRHHGIDDYVREHRFHPTRRWRLDFAWEDPKLAVEIEGVTRFGAVGRHQSPKGFEADCEKYLEAQLLGWTVLRFPHTWIINGSRMVWESRMADAIRHFLEG